MNFERKKIQYSTNFQISTNFQKNFKNKKQAETSHKFLKNTWKLKTNSKIFKQFSKVLSTNLKNFQQKIQKIFKTNSTNFQKILKKFSKKF